MARYHIITCERKIRCESSFGSGFTEFGIRTYAILDEKSRNNIRCIYDILPIKSEEYIGVLRI